MNLIYNSVITADSCQAVAQSDTILVGNWPGLMLNAGPNVWMTTILPVFVAALLSFMAASFIYWWQIRALKRERSEVAFNLFYSICDEMYRARLRVWKIIEESNNKRYLRGPFVLIARETLLARLVEVMPAKWKPSVVFRFYGLIELVAVHHNLAASLPDIHIFEVMKSRSMGKRSGGADNPSLENDFRKALDAQQYAHNFALRYLDTENEDCLTSLYIEAIVELKRLAKTVGRESDVDLDLPSENERWEHRKLIATMMSPPDEEKNGEGYDQKTQ